jgi:transcriptional regulator with XRE-family HTH domain
MTKELGRAIKASREQLGLTRRALAQQLNVHAAYISYIEKGARRPSIALLNRLAEELGLEPERLVVLAFPELKEVLIRRTQTQPPLEKIGAWDRFVGNRALLARHKVTADELGILKRISMLGRVPCVDHFLFVLNSIRQATAPRG